MKLHFKFSTLTLLITALLLWRAEAQTDGTKDPTFIAEGMGANDALSACVTQSDGKILIGGIFTRYHGIARTRIARLNTDGSLDTGFDPGTGANGEVFALSVQSDGKILIGGMFTDYNGTARNRIARLNTDGTLDMSFDPGTGANDQVTHIAVQSDGKILIGGWFTSYNGTGRNRIARLNTDGSLDMSFNPGTGANNSVRALSVQSDGKILIGGHFTSYNGTGRNRIARLNTDGSLDMSFNPGTGANSNVFALSVQSDGKILIGGLFASYNGTGRNRIARLNTDGSLDTGFNPGTGANSSVFALSVQSDGKILIGGPFTSYNGTARNRIARLNTDGSLDTGFDPGTGTNINVRALSVQSDGKILIGGDFTTYNGTGRNYVARLNTDGSLDTGFDPGTGANNDVVAIAVQSDSKILIGGLFTSYNGTARNRIARLNTDGSLDTGFDPGTGANGDVFAIAVQSDGKILIGGMFTDYNGTARNRIARLNTDGSLDTGFDPGTGTNIDVRALSIQSDGKILIGGLFTDYNGTARNRIARLNTDGSLDTGFDPGTGANNDVLAIAVQSDGKILIGGWFTSYNGTARNRIARLNTDGSLDTGFDPGTGANNQVTHIAVQSDGKILIGGNFTSYNGTARNRIARLNTDGSLDTGFDPGTGANGYVFALSVQSDGKILIGGWFTSYNGTARNRIARLNTDGSLDTGFDPGTGTNIDVRALSIQSDGKILIGGLFTIYNDLGAAFVTRILNSLCSINADAPVSGNATCRGGNGSIQINNPTGAASYEFTINAPSSSSTTGATWASATSYTPAAGTYHVWMRDVPTTCEKFLGTVTITEPAAMSTPTITSQTNIVCRGASNGQATISTPTGGVLPEVYTYDWPSGMDTQTRTDLAAGTYVVTVIACSGNQQTVTVNITEPAAMSTPTITSQTNIDCHGASNGQATISTPTGGVLPEVYTYDWPTGADTQTRTDLAAGTYVVTVIACSGNQQTVTVNITEPAAMSTPTISSQTNIDCHGASNGQATISTPTGGVLPEAYTYDWPSGADTQTRTDLAAGTYVVTVIACSGNQQTVTVNITEPAAMSTPTITSQTNIVCRGASNGQATISTPTGGATSPSYTYDWPTGADIQTRTDLVAGTYVVTITACAGGTPQMVTVNITEPAAMSTPTITSQTNIVCRGASNGQATISTPTGGVLPEGYTYDWPTGADTQTRTDLAAGTYVVTVIACSGNQQTVTVNITEPAALSFTLFNQTNNACHGGTAGALTLNNPTGGNASATYTYAWSNGGTTQAITGLAAGTYTVTVSAVGCPGVELTADYTITEAPAMSALTVASQTNITCVGVNDGAISITTPTGGSIPAGYAYSWSNGATTQGISGLSAGIYTVTVTAGMSGTCVNVTRTLEVTITSPAVMSDPVITSQTNLICHGATNGQATIGTPTGGATSPSYTYDWPSGADTQTRTDLAAGTYTVTVTACMGGTPKTVTVNITEPVQHNATVQHTPESCGGAADGTITISGSVGALDDIYEYSINSTNGTDGNWFGESTTNGRVFTGLTGSPMPGTTYRVWQRSATHPTCFFELSSVTMVAPPALTANITGFVEPPCSAPFTGSINIDVSGGNFTSQYTYLWTGPSGFSATTQNVTGITIGTYTVTITAVGCVPPLTRTLSQVINFAAIPTVNPASVTVASASTNSASISWGSVMGATNYTFRFRPVGANTWTSVINTTNTFMNLTSLQAGTTYEFQVAVSGGGSSCVSNFEPTTPRTFTTTTASGGGSTSCITPTDFVVNNVTTTTAEASWSTNAAKCYLIQYGLATQTQSTWPEVFIAHPASMLTLTGLQPGRSYRARIRANCTTCSNPSSFGTRTGYSTLVSFNTPATRESLSGLRESVSVYPNPSQGSFSVKFASEAGTVVTLRLLDLKGTVVYESTHSATDGENILPVVIEHYTRGIYALQIQRGTQVTTTRVSLD